MEDHVCINWCLVKYLYPTDRNQVRITKADKDFAKAFHFKGIKFPEKAR